MSLNLTDLDAVTRQHMLRELNEELAVYPYVPASLSPLGLDRWPDMLRDAVQFGDDTTLLTDLSSPGVFNQTEMYTRNGVTRSRAVNARQAAERLAASEFNTAYVHGVSARYLAEGISHVLIYRAAEPKWEVAGCAQHEGLIVPTQDVYDGHRLAYWPNPHGNINPNAVAIPFQAGCHHSIRVSA